MDYLIEIERVKAVTEQAMNDAKSLADQLPDGLTKVAALTLVSQLVQATVALSIRRPAVPCRLDFVAADAPEPTSGPMRHAVNAVLAERLRQVTTEGWTPAHDDKHSSGDLSKAAGCYALFSEAFPDEGKPPPQWPWAREWWKPKDCRHDLVRAAALLIAEIERIDRREERAELADADTMPDFKAAMTRENP